MISLWRPFRTQIYFLLLPRPPLRSDLGYVMTALQAYDKKASYMEGRCPGLLQFEPLGLFRIRFPHFIISRNTPAKPDEPL
jgi:hypothetical protein